MGVKISGLSMNNNYFGTNSSNVSTLFSSLQTNGVSSMSGLISDYTSIRNGSYTKLLSKYYSNTADQKEVSSVDKKNPVQNRNNTLLSTAKSAASNLKSAVNTLTNTGKDSVFAKKQVQKEDGSVSEDYDTDAIYDAVSSYVKNYNEAVKASNESGSSSVKNAANGMERVTSMMSDRLAKVGISYDEDGKLAIDEDTFKKADMANVKSLFNGSSSYAAGIGTSASAIASTAGNQLSMNAGSVYGNDGSYTSSSAYVGSLFSGYL